MEAYNGNISNRNRKLEKTGSGVLDDDPPWRTTGSPYLGRRILWTTQHKASARRTVSVEQIGIVVGWISETDVDTKGQPGFLSEKTGQPAALYHIVFNDEPSRHPYASVLIGSVDVEEYELVERLLDDDDDDNNENHGSRKKARTR